MSSQGVEFFSRLHIPEFYCAVLTARSHRLAVGAKTHARNMPAIFIMDKGPLKEGFLLLSPHSIM